MSEEMKRFDVNRTRLETVIPLATPFVVHVDPCDTCNFRCKFCPTSRRELMRSIVGRNHGPMDFELFKKVINDIQMFDRRSRHSGYTRMASRSSTPGLLTWWPWLLTVDVVRKLIRLQTHLCSLHSYRMLSSMPVFPASISP